MLGRNSAAGMIGVDRTHLTGYRITNPKV